MTTIQLCLAALLAALATTTVHAGSTASDVSVTVTVPPFPSAGTTFLVRTTYTNTLPTPGEALLTVELSQGWNFLGSGDCQGFAAHGAGAAQAVRTIAHNEVVQCTLSFGIPATFSGEVEVLAKAIAFNDPNLGNNSYQAASQVVRLRVNTTTDGVDDNPGDGICRHQAGSAVCSLRAALIEANALTGMQTVELPFQAATYQLTRTGADTAAFGDLDITDAVWIVGEPNAAGLLPTVGATFASDSDRVLDVDAPGATVIVQAVRLAGQQEAVAVDGAVVRHREGHLVLALSEIVDGVSSTRGGGVFAAATLTLSQSIVRENYALRGAGVAVVLGPGERLLLLQTEVTDNLASGDFSDGGGLYIDGGSAEVSASLVAYNGAGDGGGIYAIGTSLSAENSTLHGNSAEANGGALFLAYTDAQFDFVTVTDNAAAPGNEAAGLGGGLYLGPSATAAVANSIVAGNTAQLREQAGAPVPVFRPYAAACFGAVASGGYNAVQPVSLDTQCSWAAAGGDALDTFVSLDPLADNGGSTRTRALPTGSPAVDSASPACTGTSAALGTDQRLRPRPTDGDGDGSARCDKGAYELQPVTPAVFASGFEESA